MVLNIIVTCVVGMFGTALLLAVMSFLGISIELFFFLIHGMIFAMCVLIYINLKGK
ncbi:hypothetical protein [Geomicrobium sp. JCM 19038]|uniref:hypothetical protein n=1 Tax=Geomicrobium sp. JCM 19038 TaxID=1460635 RepID=UPI00045F3E73|nr:hypothetical protein [Geomicrobium sp. JCM 19038]GAK08190.1 hypothetical protein JCM19038_1965 [Geomicrobium sp. JCM 19038]